jgi:hypothetical protein
VAAIIRFICSWSHRAPCRSFPTFLSFTQRVRDRLRIRWQRAVRRLRGREAQDSRPRRGHIVHRDDWKPQGENRSLGDLAVHGELAAYQSGEATPDRHTQTGPRSTSPGLACLNMTRSRSAGMPSPLCSTRTYTMALFVQLAAWRGAARYLPKRAHS